MTDTRSAIAALHAAWVAAVARGTAEDLRALVTDDYEAWANAAPAVRGPEAVVAAMGAALERYAVEQSFEPLELIVSGDLAVERGVERIAVTPRTGGDTVRRAQRALMVMRLGGDGRWRYARGMTCALPVEGNGN